MTKKNEFNSSRNEYIKKKRNKIVKILDSSKIWYLFKFRNPNKIQNSNNIKELNFPKLNGKVVFIKLNNH